MADRLEAILSYHLQSPSFIWLFERGSGSGVDGRVQLTQFELASRLAFRLTDFPPDETLYKAAKSSLLNSKDSIRTQAVRLLNSDHGKKKIVQSLLRWSSMGQAASITQLPAYLTDGIQLDGLEDAMVSEAADYIEYMVFNQRVNLTVLLNSKLSFAKHEGLAKIYGHAPVTDGVPVNFPNQRKGLLMRAPFFTGGSTRTDIIHRGLDFHQHILCGNIPEPTVDIANSREDDVLTPEQKLKTSNRDALAYQTKRPVCMQCHGTINPTGGVFEMFDPLGRIREQEAIFDESGKFLRNIAVNPSADVPTPGGRTVASRDGADLIDYVAKSSEGNECFVRNSFRFMYEKAETPADDCQLEFSFQSLIDKDKPIFDMFVEMAIHPTMQFKYVE
jgi:hypothetical protein